MAMSADLAGGHWRPSTITTESLAPETPIYVAFSEDGKVTGFGGCNRFFGGYTIEGNSIKIGPLASTRKGCPDTLNLEVEFFKALQEAVTFEQTETALVLFGPGGDKLAELIHTDNT
jgi:putative lipoprotein